MIRAGALVLVVLATAAVVARVTADPLRGERAFQRCYACHSVGTEEERLTGPSLRCVIGRPAGTLPGFEFSVAMVDAGRTRGLVWTRETLDAFLVDPQEVVPGTAMWIPPLPTAGERQDLIDYLERAGPCPDRARGVPKRRRARPVSGSIPQHIVGAAPGSPVAKITALRGGAGSRGQPPGP